MTDRSYKLCDSWLFLFGLLLFATLPATAAETTRVFVLAGQSNMEGWGVVSRNHPEHYNHGLGNLVWALEHSDSREKMAHLLSKSGKWVTRNDVRVSYKPVHHGEEYTKAGFLGIGYTSEPGEGFFGPELQFGHIVGDHFEDPVFIIKTAWGGKSLMKDFRPPSSGGDVGPYYTKMVEQVKKALRPFRNRSYEISGFVWMQGWNDMVGEDSTAEYESNLINLVKDIREEFETPEMPVIIGELGNTDKAPFREIQKKAAAKIDFSHFVETRAFLREARMSPNTGHGHHWYGNAESYFLIGDALGHATVDALKEFSGSAEPAYETLHSINGEKIEAIILFNNGKTISIKRKDGQVFKNIPIARFSKEDQEKLKENLINPTAFVPSDEDIFKIEEHATKQRVRIEAEHFDEHFNTHRIENPIYSNNQAINFESEQDAWVKWDSIRVREAGYYSISISYAHEWDFTNEFLLSVNGQQHSLRHHAFQKISGLDPIGEVRFCAYLEQGRNSLMLETVNYIPTSIDHIVVAPVSTYRKTLLYTLQELENHIDAGTNPTTGDYSVIIRELENSIHSLYEGNGHVSMRALQVVESYENIYGPLFRYRPGNSPADGWERSKMKPDLAKAVMVVMQGIMDHLYQNPKAISKLSSLLDGFWFQSSEHFPGIVATTPNPQQIHTTTINCDYPKARGPKIAYEGTPARRPTGTYLAPGSIATLTVPDSMIGAGYKVRVGAHSQDHWERPWVKRLDRVSIVLPIEQSPMQIANPLGGGIYIEVPHLSDQGLQEIEIKNAVRSPYFSNLPYRKTSNEEWITVESQHDAPWTDIQSEKYMIQVPTYYVQKAQDLESFLDQWDLSLDFVSKLAGFPSKRGRELLYEQYDIEIKGPAFSTGHPQINRIYAVNDPTNRFDGRHEGLLEGVENSDTMFHELGHQINMQRFPGEIEVIVNLPHAAALQQVFNYSWDEALRSSLGYDSEYVTMDTTAINWMTTESFALGNPMSGLEMQYQPKGHAEYLDIARLFGWSRLATYWRSLANDEEAEKEIDRSKDALIVRLSTSVESDVSPLLHFWGIHPDNFTSVRNQIQRAGLKPSQKIYDLIVRYKELIPQNLESFQHHAQSWWEEELHDPDPNYVTRRYHGQIFDEYGDEHIAAIEGTVSQILDRYFPRGRPRS